MTDFFVRADGSTTPAGILTAKGVPLATRIRVAYTFWKLCHGGRVFNVSCRKVGGLRFLKLGRLTFMFCVSNAYRPL